MAEPLPTAGSASRREDQIRAATVGELEVHSGTILLVEYDAVWPRVFEQEGERARAALGDRALRVEHVGSTSVPGLAAKPIIDMLLVVADSSDEPSYVAHLQDAGYALRIREPDWYQHRLLKGPEANINLHVFSDGCKEIDRMVAFRDRLRTHDSDRELYLRAKRHLAAQTWTYVQDYADAKTAVIEEILKRTGFLGDAATGARR
jgi:GrpB-like predicted nucleotidyltransferase (UPF0157 family)